MADESLRAWTKYTGGTAWPTVVLAGATLAVWSATVVGHGSGYLPTPFACLLAAIAAYVSFTPLHEATHGNVGGKQRPWLDTVVGWASGIPLLGPFPAFKALHLRHHAKTNHPELDPDMWVAGSGLGVLGRCLTIMPHYYSVFLGPLADESSSARRARPVALAYLASVASLLFLAAWAGWAVTVVAVILVPAWMAMALLAFLFDWVPHHPHDVQGRYLDTRAIPSTVLEVAMLAQNLHLVHHLWPSVPFYRYGAVFRLSREALEAKGASVGDALLADVGVLEDLRS